jgi:ligand-binding sensor domain-containing protein
MYLISAVSFLILLVLIPVSMAANYITPELTTNYSDFSLVTAIAVGYQYVYFGTTHGITRYDINRGEWADPLVSIDGGNDQQIYEMRASFDDENIWVKNEYGMYEYSETLKSWSPASNVPDDNPRVRHLAPDAFYFAPWGYDYMPEGILVDDFGRRFALTDIVDDSWANLWIGTWGLGAAWADEDGRRIELLEYGLLQKDITAVCLDSTLLWMGGRIGESSRNGLTLFDRSQNRFDYIESIIDLRYVAEDVNDIYVSDSNAFVATNDGIWVIDKDDKKIRERLSRRSGLPDNRVLTVMADGGRLIAGTEYGLGILDIYSDSAEQMAQLLLPSEMILCLEMAGDDLWIGTTRGAYRFDLKVKTLARLTAPEITRYGRIFDLDHADGKMWIATEYELASIDLSTARIELFPEIMNFGGVQAVAVKDTVVAVATGSGLLLIYTGDRQYHQLYTVDDGLISNNIRDLVFDEQYLWLGTDEGLTRFWYTSPSL